MGLPLVPESTLAKVKGEQEGKGSSGVQMDDGRPPRAALKVLDKASQLQCLS